VKDAAKKTPKTMAAMTVLQIELDIKRVPPPKSPAAMGAHTRNRTQGGCSASRIIMYDEYAYATNESDGAPDEKERRPKQQPPGYQACMKAR
jgi:hypothetical protein